MVPSADWLTKIVTLGPPVLLVIGLLIILNSAVRDKMDLKKTGLLSAIVAAFFGLWLIALPQMQTRRVEIVPTLSSKQLRDDYSLKPIQYSINVNPIAKDGDLDTFEFEFPRGTDRLRMQLNLEALIRSYQNNLETLIEVARADPDCFDRAIRGRNYAQVAAIIYKDCPGSLTIEPSAPAPARAGLQG
ncbi:MAG TPA: hypothetical protein VEA61_14580 [Allosphingosinicella sp.]|nr:hypothetical protein [Allosphingosinicella sp.]